MTARPAVVPSGQAMRSVAVIDAHRHIRETLVELLTRELDLRVVASCERGGPAAVAVVERFAPDVVLIDPALPDGAGVDTVREIRQRWPRIRVVLLTAATFRRAAADAVAAGAHACVSKSQPFSAILAAVRDDQPIRDDTPRQPSQ